MFVVLSHRVWRDLYGGDPHVVGSKLRFVDAGATVVGVAAREFDIPHGADLWVNARLNMTNIGHGMEGYVRIRPGSTTERLAGQLAGVMAGLAHDYPTVDTGRTFTLTPLVDAIVGDLKPTLMVVLSATVLLLALACVNVTVDHGWPRDAPFARRHDRVGNRLGHYAGCRGRLVGSQL